MTNRQSSENQTRTNRRASRRINETVNTNRSHRKRGVLPSFGDIVLPVVGVAAIGLLAVAGRQFFINGIQSSPGIASTRAYADSPVLIAEREKRERDRLRQTIQNESNNENESEKQKNEIPEKNDFIPSSNILNENVNSKNNNLTVTVTTAQPQKIAKPVTPNQPSKTAPKNQKTVNVKQEQQTKNNNSNSAKSAKPAKIPDSKQWRVQIGAYGTKKGAQDAAKKINSAGHRTIVYSNPSSKYTKVWVLAGASKQEAEKIASSMKKLGYSSAFAVPPMK